MRRAIGKSAVYFGDSKVCAKLVSRILIEFIMEQKVVAVQELLEGHNTDTTFLSRIVTGDEIWIH